VNYSDALAWLYATQTFGIKLGLENIRRLLEALNWHGREQRFLHVAGTNGKGSVCAMLDAICRAADVRTGLFTSPHLVTFRERIRINGEMIAEEKVASGLARVREIVRDWETHPTFFEITTALALDHFQNERAKIVVLETGMGGRFDATNVVTPAASIITAIDFDHQAWLGTTLREIAGEKAGIIKPGVPVITLPQHAEAAEVLKKSARDKDAPFSVVAQPLENVVPALAGSHQKLHAALAVQALCAAGIRVSDSALREGLSRVEWPGRFQRIGERIILDGAHNPAAARRLAGTWREEFGNARATIVLGVSKDKDIAEICAALTPIAMRVIATPVQNPRAANAQEIRDVFDGNNVECVVAENLPHALDLATARAGRILITGSFFLVGEALAHLRSEALEISIQ